MTQQFGTTAFAEGTVSDITRLSLSEGPLEIGWNHCSTTSDFLSDFYAMLAGKNGADYVETRHSIGYLVNELLENAVKFRSPGDIVVEAGLADGCFEMRVSNHVETGTARRFQKLLEELTVRDPGDLLIERIEQNAEDPEAGGSGLGLLTLMSDYGVELGWTFGRGASKGTMRLQACASLSL